MGKTKDYTDEQERIARDAKAMGHRGTESEILYQPDQLGGSQTIIFSFFLSL